MAEQPIIIKKKIVKGHGHHGGSWKVAYADFVTAMMAFFMVMWLMNMSEDVRDQIQGYFNDPMGMSNKPPKSVSIKMMEGVFKPKPATTAGRGAGDKAATAEQKTLEKVKASIGRAISEQSQFKNLSKDIRISITPEGLLIEFIEAKGAVFFESGSAIIRPEALRIVATIAPILTNSKHMLAVQGHTDAQTFHGRVNGNWALSTERALSLQEALEGDLVPDKQFANLQAFAATHLLDPDHPLAYVNRRVTILLPREYTSDQITAAPGDVLHAAISEGSQPEAVMTKPKPPNFVPDITP